MANINSKVLDLIKERYQVKNPTLVPFDEKMTPLSLEGEVSGDEHIFLLDENGGRVTTLLYGETVSDALKLLDENAADVAYVLSLESETISSIIHS